mgnify:CR=1 FL=1
MWAMALSLLAFVSAILTIYADYRKRQGLFYVCKPLTMLLIILIAFQAKQSVEPFYLYMILIGLLFSLAGDIFLMLPDDRFIAGLASFLVAHICYLVAFSRGTALISSPWALILLLLYGAVMFRVLLPHLDKMKSPVLMYNLVIVMMVWRAWERSSQVPGMGTRLACVGAILFLISDSALALNRFVAKYKGAQALILGTYFAAQWLIAMSA